MGECMPQKARNPYNFGPPGGALVGLWRLGEGGWPFFRPPMRGHLRPKTMTTALRMRKFFLPSFPLRCRGLRKYWP